MRYGISAFLVALSTVLVSYAAPARPSSDADRIAEAIKRFSTGNTRDKNDAVNELKRYGMPAAEAVAKAARGSEGETARELTQLAETLKTAARNAAYLAPTMVELTLTNAKVSEAIDVLSKQSGYQLVYSGANQEVLDKKITLATGKVTFWQALGALCDAAGVKDAITPARPPGGFRGQLEIAPGVLNPGVAVPLPAPAVIGPAIRLVPAVPAERPQAEDPKPAVEPAPKRVGDPAPPKAPAAGPVNPIQKGAKARIADRVRVDRPGLTERARERAKERTAQDTERIEVAPRVVEGKADEVPPAPPQPKPAVQPLPPVRIQPLPIRIAPAPVAPAQPAPAPPEAQPVQPALPVAPPAPPAAKQPAAPGQVATGPWAGARSNGNLNAPIRLVDGKPEKLPVLDNGAIRVKAMPVAEAARHRLEGVGQMVVVLEFRPEPKLSLTTISSITLDKAIDQQDQVIEQSPNNVLNRPVAPKKLGGPAIGAANPIFDRATGTRYLNDGLMPLVLQKGEKESTSLKQLTGKVTMSLLAPREVLLTLDDVTKPHDAVHSGELGMAYVGTTKLANGNYTVVMESRTARGPDRVPISSTVGYNLPSLSCELTDAAGNKFGQSSYSSSTKSTADLVVRSIRFTITPPKGEHGEPTKVVISGSRTITTEVPFQLKDVPVK